MLKITQNYYMIITFIFTLILTLNVSSNTIINKNKLDYKRIIALSPHAVEMLYAIGAGNRIIATVDYADYPPAAKNIPRIGSYTGIDIEKILKLQPDLIIGWKNGNKQGDLLKLESLGFKIFYTDPKNIHEISIDLLKLGKLTGLSSKAKLVAEQFISKYKAIKMHYANKSKVRVFYQLWADPLRSVGKKSWIESLIHDCNGENIFNQSNSSYPIISLESILQKNPQVIIIPEHFAEHKLQKNALKNWKMIDAIQNKHVFSLNGDLLHRVGPRAIEGLYELCMAIDKARH